MRSKRYCSNNSSKDSHKYQQLDLISLISNSGEDTAVYATKTIDPIKCSHKKISTPERDILTFHETPITYTDEQKLALRKITEFLSDSKNSVFILSGYAGTGKTTIAENVVRYALYLQKDCIITAPTHQAVKVLKDKLGDIKVAFKTLHSTLYGSPDIDTGKWIPSVSFDSDHVLLVDESSMISKPVYTDLINAIKLAHAKVIFFGDNFQLEPVGDDPEIFPNKDFELTEIKRQGARSEILLYSTCLRNLKQIIIPNQSCGEVNILSKQDTLTAFLQSVINNENSIFIVGTNKARIALNQKARKVKFGTRIIDAPQHGDKIIFIGNSTSFINGDKLTLEQFNIIASKALPIRNSSKSSPNYIKAYLIINDRHRIILLPAIESPSVYHAQFIDPDKHFPADWCDKNLSTRKHELSKGVSIATYGYVITAHKSQGSQWEKVFVHQDAFRDNPRWLYTAVTRAERKLTLTNQSNPHKLAWDKITEIANKSNTAMLPYANIQNGKD